MNVPARWVHLVALATWLGGSVFLAAVLVPLARRLPEAARRELIEAAGRRFRIVAWVALAALVASGLAALPARPDLLARPAFHAKLGLVAAVLALSVLHDFVLGPRANRSGDPAARRRVAWLARANLLLALAIVWLGLSFR